jgi:hypothetical protein
MTVTASRKPKARRSNPQDEKDRARALGGTDVAASPGVGKGMKRAARQLHRRGDPATK